MLRLQGHEVGNAGRTPKLSTPFLRLTSRDVTRKKHVKVYGTLLPSFSIYIFPCCLFFFLPILGTQFVALNTLKLPRPVVMITDFGAKAAVGLGSNSAIRVQVSYFHDSVLSLVTW